MSDASDLLAVYDEHLRGVGEVASATDWTTHGPLWLARFGRHGMVTYRSLAGLDGDEVDALVTHAGAHFAARSDVTEWEWKTRSHDEPADLARRLAAAGLVAEDVETIMLGEAARLVSIGADLALPADVEVRRVDLGAGRETWLARAAALQRDIFGQGPTDAEVLARFADPGRSGMWVAARGDEVLAAGRLEIVPDTPCAGLWGGGVHPAARGQGLYRALVAARAAWALERGVRYLHSDCTAMSRPILERAGLVAVTTSTPYVGRA